MAKVLTLWIDKICQGPMDEALKGAEIHDGTTDNLADIMDHPLDPPPPLILCGSPKSGSLLEVAQTISMTYPVSPVVFLTSNKDGFNRADLIKNGFADAFLIPFESVEFKNKVAEALSRAASNPIESFRTVKLLDFQGDDPLEFDTFIFLPLRKKYIRYSHAGKELNQEQVARLKSHEVSSLHLKQSDMPKFYQFTAQQLVNLGKSETMSETEKQEKMQNAVRSVVAGVFTETNQGSGFDPGRKLISDCQEIVKSYIKASSDNKNTLYERISSMAQDGEGTYSHATNVATFSSLFAMGLGIGNPEEIAMAGLLCDVGLAELPADLQLKSAKERTPEEERQYRKHPEMSLHLLKSKRMIMPEKVQKIILQHHENYDGKGYPGHLTADRIIPEAQIVGLASDFADLLVIKEGRKRLTPREAIEEIRKTESGRRFAPDFLFRIGKLLFSEDAAGKAA